VHTSPNTGFGSRSLFNTPVLAKADTAENRVIPHMHVKASRKGIPTLLLSSTSTDAPLKSLDPCLVDISAPHQTLPQLPVTL
jgi:hypothetical protein